MSASNAKNKAASAGGGIKAGAATDVSESGREIVITRVFDAHREMVWNAMTDPQQVVQWWGPNGFSTTIHKMDVRPGGVWEQTLHGPDGANYPNKSVFREVIKPERIVYSHGGGREGGPGASFVSTWTFEDLGGKTRVTIRQEFKTARERDDVVKNFNAIEGGKQTLGRLAAYLSGLEKGGPAAGEGFTVSRVFDAPREKVWKAFTEAGRMQQWWGPKGTTATVLKLEFRPGGTFLYRLNLPDGRVWWGKWTYREIREPELLVNVGAFCDEQGNLARHPLNADWPLEVLHTATFTEESGKTRITVTGFPINATELERKTFAEAYKFMDEGFQGTWDKLDAYLARV